MRPVKHPPCTECPKFRLFRNLDQPGLDPRNALAVRVYQLAARDIRAGDSAVLTGTISIPDVIALLDEFSEHLPTSLARQETLELVKLLDRVAVEVRGPAEAALRQQTMDKARNQAGSAGMPMRRPRARNAKAASS